MRRKAELRRRRRQQRSSTRRTDDGDYDDDVTETVNAEGVQGYIEWSFGPGETVDLRVFG